MNEILQDLRRKGLAGRPAKCSIATDDHMSFHYVIDAGVCFLTLSQTTFNKRLVFGFLDNALMLLGGDAIEATVGSSLNLSQGLHGLFF